MLINFARITEGQKTRNTRPRKPGYPTGQYAVGMPLTAYPWPLAILSARFSNHTKSLTWPGLTSQIQSIRRKIPDSRQIGTKRRWWMTLDSRSLDFVIAGA